MSKLALTIGINDYSGSGSDLAGCINDMLDNAAVLEKRGFEVRQLPDREATGKGIRDAIQALVDRAIKGDSLVVTYSGHGSYVDDDDGDETDGTDEIICPWDINSDYITDDELFQYASQARAKGAKMVLISDSCHSGTVMRFVTGKLPPPIEGADAIPTKVRFLPPENFVDKKRVERIQRALAYPRSKPKWKYGGLLVSGSQDLEYSYDASFNGRPNGAFTYVALKALEAMPKGGSYKLWHKNIRKALPTSSYPQSPNLFGASNMKSRWRVFE